MTAARLADAPSVQRAGVVPRQAWRLGALAENVTAQLIEEVPVALVYNGVSHAVMLASPSDLADFALGFSLSEGIIATPDELLDLEIVSAGEGIELRLTITARPFAGLKDRRRALTGRSGCGLCGVESLADAMRPLPRLDDRTPLSLEAIHRALDGLAPMQRLNRQAGAVHAAAWADPDGAIRHLAEDVGRHNAFDKVIGAMAGRRGGRPPGFAVLTSRLSYELVQKAATTGISALVAISAPTALAVEAADRAGICVVALARADAVTVYAHPARIANLAGVA
ncbi:MAG TPA: formate dehydrogenase accessory sulfurtransferase FdhD [Aliidongia sp.]|uniref:formate dehydrogenase accessory sulfurtransferase FdhD n=1 Tax=Aliidongia sp. TaxID=1914230 RepID=UPI002DDCB7C2|nr:formate dehydrogenase accessory sulfurtransferase FdhD [Aliidongia sp.]HEV2674851.1 formate dehydrogenase accessory sulfurtransferase FdhD [Aliidongia sp.]